MFKIGQKIVCVKVNPLGTLKEGEIYTVKEVRSCTGGVKLKEVEATDRNASGYFAEWRFRPIDTSWAEELLNELLEEINEEELVCTGRV